MHPHDMPDEGEQFANGPDGPCVINRKSQVVPNNRILRQELSLFLGISEKVECEKSGNGTAYYIGDKYVGTLSYLAHMNTFNFAEFLTVEENFLKQIVSHKK